MIGLIDLDIASSSSSKLIVPNLEIMKLATYYRLEKNQFCRLISLEEANDLTNYDQIFCFSESHATPVIPPAFLRVPNIVYGGTGFTNGIYIPFKNELIDFTLPKPTIYKEYLKQLYNDGIKAKVISRALDNSYYRFYSKERLPIPPIKKNKAILIYDINFFCQDWQEIVSELEARRPSTIISIHPIVCKKITDFFNLRNFRKISREKNNIILDLNIPLEDVYYMLNKYKKFLLAEITQYSNVYLKIGDSFSTTTQYRTDLIYKLNLLYCFWSYNIPIKLWYEPARIGFHNSIEELEKKIAIWSKTAISKDISINDRINFKTKKSEWAIERDTILKFFPHEKILFTQSYNNISKGGRWRYEH